ncbi:MAG: hypothetical protein KF830_17915 [Planctomycetes bacterium]|nr:hypothetical protein [Planctomycetota bacterium]
MTGRRFAQVLTLALAACGAALAVDAWWHGGLMRYRVFGVALGVVMATPLLVVLVFGDRGWRLLRHLVFALLPVTALLLVLELALRSTGVGWFAVETVASERLGHALAPGRGGTDDNGFRNESVPARADVVIVGDSQTYGHGVGREQCYVQQLAALTGRVSYGMALGGYGPVQYRELVEHALDLSPSDVVVALYLGNDLIDAHRFAWLPVAEDLRSSEVHYEGRDEVVGVRARAPNLAMALVDAACSASRVIGSSCELLRSALRGQGGLYVHEPGAPRWTGGGVTTLFQVHRLPALDPAEPAVQDGLRITRLCLLRIGELCRRAGARAWLLLLPTKEACYQRWLGQGSLPELAAVTAAEAEATAAVVAMAAEAGLRLVDPTAALVAELAAGHAMWPAGSDGHFAAAGHAVLARELAAAMR